MIYISSSCVKSEKICDSVECLAREGFKNIELSGGTKYYDDIEKDLIHLKETFGLNYLVHNYFPPPEYEFVLNLASGDEDIYDKTIQHYQTAIEFAQKLGSQKFGLHAGYYFDINVEEIGREISFSCLNDKNRSLEKFCKGFELLQKESKGIQLYIENNVISESNYKNFQETVPFMLTDLQSYRELKERIDFPLLLDIAHLKVSANILQLNFREELNQLIPCSDYIHVSENDGFHDVNTRITEESEIIDVLKSYSMQDKVITIEVYDQMDELKRSFEIVEKIVHKR